MFPMPEKPTEFLDALTGKITGVNFINNQLILQLYVYMTTLELTTDQFTFNLGDTFVQKAVMSSVAAHCWDNGSINFNRLKNHEVAITFKQVTTEHGHYTNLLSILLLDRLVTFNYESDGVS